MLKTRTLQAYRIKIGEECSTYKFSAGQWLILNCTSGLAGNQKLIKHSQLKKISIRSYKVKYDKPPYNTK